MGKVEGVCEEEFLSGFCFLASQVTLSLKNVKYWSLKIAESLTYLSLLAGKVSLESSAVLLDLLLGLVLGALNLSTAG